MLEKTRVTFQEKVAQNSDSLTPDGNLHGTYL